jgi:hypothetical protein
MHRLRRASPHFVVAVGGRRCSSLREAADFRRIHSSFQRAIFLVDAPNAWLVGSGGHPMARMGG